MSLLQSIISEGITHVEDLPNLEFIRTIESIKEKIVTEKIDGANLWFGLDDKGLYTSREGKNSKQGRFYKVTDYPLVANYNGFRAAHLAIEQVEATIRKFLKVGDQVEMEVMFGRQPNTVTYGNAGKSYIVFLRGVNGTPDDRVHNLANGLAGKTVEVKTTVISSPDGDELVENEEQQKWEFTKVAPIVTKDINTKEALVLLAKLKKFLGEKNKVLTDKTNQEVCDLSLTSVPKDQRVEAKEERARLNAEILDTYKAPIKELLLNNFVRKIKPALQGKDLHPSEDIGVEGVVVRDPITGSMAKIVDKDVFTAINAFNNVVRGQVAGLVRTTDASAPSELRGGAFGQARIKIAELLGAKELALSSGTKRFITKFKKDSAMATALELAKNLHLNNLSMVRTQVASILKETITEVDGILHQFKNESGEFKLKLKTGKEIGLTPEVMKRTLTAFAETKKEIKEIISKVLQSRSAADLIMALYGKTIESLFSGEDMEVAEAFNLLKSINEDGEAGGGAGAGAGGATGAGAVGGAAPSGQAAPIAISNVSKGTTSAGNIAPYMFKMGTKQIIKRKRGFEKPKKFPMPVFEPKGAKMGVPESKFSILRTMTEDWAHVKDMKFATDVDDTAASENDVEFNQLRNNVKFGDKVTGTDVDHYLDKAHELNDQVDTVCFGMEQDDGSVIKVFVNAGQADEFEASLADMLGKENDAETVINELSNKFDIVDVEWPQAQAPTEPSAGAGQPAPEGEQAGETPEVPAEPRIEGEPDIDMTLNTEEEPTEGEAPQAEPSAEGEAAPESSETPAEEPTGEEGESTGEEEGEESTGEEERDEFGQVIKKKAKKEKTEESFSLLKGLQAPVLVEADPASVTFNNPTVQLIADVLMVAGVDLTANRSLATQLKQLISRNDPKLLALKQSNVAARFKTAVDTFNQVLKLTPGTAVQAPDQATPVTAGYQLLGDVIVETERAENKWIIGRMGSNGVLLRGADVTIKLDFPETAKLLRVLKANKRGIIHSSDEASYTFKPSENGYHVTLGTENDKKAKSPAIFIPDEVIADLIKELETE